MDVITKMRLDGKAVLVVGRENSWLPEIESHFAAAGGKITVFGPYTTTTGPSLKEVLEKTGKIDILVNSYNFEFARPALETSDEEWDRVISANLTAVFSSCRTVAREMVRSGGGSIVNIASGAGDSGVPNMSAYCASMGGVFALTRALALEWAPRGIRVNTIGVGWRADPQATADEESESLLLRYIPVKRRCRPEEVLPLAVFLASDSASYMDGHVFYADGGMSARG